MSREVEFQQELYYQLRKVIETHHEIGGLSFQSVQMEYPVDSGRADIVIFLAENKPFVIIETKKKNGHVSKNIDPLSSRVIQQALGYAMALGAPYIATANREFLASFTLPAKGEPFTIDRHRILITQIQTVTEDFVIKLLEAIVNYHLAITLEEKSRLATAIDWTFIIRLRSFVSWLTREVEPGLAKRMRDDSAFLTRLRDFEEERGITKLTPERLSRQMSYILANKILFYKILERRYPKLPKLQPYKSETAASYLDELNGYFERAIDETKDFEAIFKTEIYDSITLPEQSHTLLEAIDGLNAFIEDMETYKLEDLGSDIIGHVYEELIPAEERHQIGQFYTPPPVAEMICRWCVTSDADRILDPAVGSGTFPVKAYKRLKELKLAKGTTKNERELHREILNQLFSVDIDPFPAHLTAMNLAMQSVNNPVSEMNILQEDFFNLSPDQAVLVPYSVKTPNGDLRRQITIPRAQAVVANPPYTRWLEIPNGTRKAIELKLGKTLRNYGLQARIRGGVETGIYIHFIMHAASFLDENSRLGMIISNAWLQNDYGINFAKYLVENFKVHAVIDFSSRLFQVPIVATCIVLLEKTSSASARNNNESVFLYVDKETEIVELLDAVKNPQAHRKEFMLEVFHQSELPRDEKWIGVLFGRHKLERAFAHFSVKLVDLFEVFRGNIEYSASESRGLGANDFFYIDEETTRQWGLGDYVTPVLTSPRSSRFFTFSKADWAVLRKRGSRCYLFLCSEPRSKLPRAVREYIKWGETECKTGYEGICSQAQACKEREHHREKFRGWFDVGGLRKYSVFTGYTSRYVHRFALAQFGVALDADFIALKPKQKFTDKQLKAILAYLNSSFVRFYVELVGRASGGVTISLEVNQAEQIPVPDVQKLDHDSVDRLATLFDALEEKTRELGGADKLELLEGLHGVIVKIDEQLIKALKIDSSLAKMAARSASILMERRLSKMTEAEPEVLKGEEKMIRISAPSRKARRSDPNTNVASLDKWAGSSQDFKSV
jgi:type I restriction-modification system DNA methylase subunit